MSAIKIRRLLKAAQNQLNMDDGLYRANLVEITGKESSTQLNYQECVAVLKHFESLGYVARKNPREGQIKRITYLWLRLGEAKVLSSQSRTSMYAFCRRFTGDVSLYKAKREQLSACIEALKDWCKREQVAIND